MITHKRVRKYDDYRNETIINVNALIIITMRSITTTPTATTNKQNKIQFIIIHLIQLRCGQMREHDL